MLVVLLSSAAVAYILISVSLLFVLFENAVYGKPQRTINYLGAAAAVYPDGGLSVCRALISAVLFILSFYFIPMGSLPSFARLHHNILLFYASFFSALLFSHFRSSGWNRNPFFTFLTYDGVKFLLLLTFVFLLFALFASGYGLPGELLSFETYSAPLLFKSAGPCGKAGFVLFALLLASFAPSGEKRGSAFLRIAHMFEALAYPALVTALFVPLNIGLLLKLFGLPLFAADLLFFWAKVFLIKEAVQPVMRFILRPSAGDPYARRHTGRTVLVFCLAALLFAYDIYRIL